MTYQPPPGQPQYGPPPGYRPPPPGYQPPNPQWRPPPKSKQPIWLWFVLGGTAIVVIAGLAFSAVAGEHGPTKPTQTVGTPAASGGVGAQVVRSGSLQFTVTKVEQGATSSGNRLLSQDAKGEYVFVTVEVENVGDSGSTFFGDDQKLIDDRDRRFDSDSSAESDLNHHSYVELNPGAKQTVILPFDVPKGTVPAAIDLSAGMFSKSARIQLR